MPDGTALAITNHRDNTVHLWTPQTRAELGVLATDHKLPIHTLALVPWSDGRTLLATGSRGSSLRLWDPATGERVDCGTPPVSELFSVVPLAQPDRPPLLAISGDTGTVLWDPLARELVSENWLEDEVDSVQRLVAVPVESGPPLLVGLQGRIWRSDSGAIAGRLTGVDLWMSRAITTLPLPNARTLLAIATDIGVRLWDPSASQLFDTVTPMDTVTTVAAVSAASGEMLLVTGDNQGRVRLWDTSDGTQVGVLQCGTGASVINLTVVSQPGQADLLCTSSGGTIQLWDLASTTLLAEWVASQSGVTALAAVALPDGQTRLATLDNNAMLRIWDLTGRGQVGPALRIRQRYQGTRVFAVPMRGGRTLLATYGGGAVVRLWDPERVRAARRGLRNIELDPNRRARCVAPVTLADGRTLLATAGIRDTPQLWDTTTWQSFGEVLDGDTWGDVNALVAIPCPDGGDLLAGGDEDGRVRIWDPQSGTLLLTAVIGEPIQQLAALGAGLAVRMATGVIVLDLNLSTMRSHH